MPKNIFPVAAYGRDRHRSRDIFGLNSIPTARRRWSDGSRNIFRVTRVEQEVKSEGDWTPTPTGDRVRGRSSVPHRIGNQRKRAGAHGRYRRLGKIVLSHLVMRSRAGYLFVGDQCSETSPLEARNARADAEPGWRGIGPTTFFTAALARSKVK
jgi:hypothetical protein